MSECYHLIPLSELASLRTEKVFRVKDISKPYIGLEHIPSDEPVLISTAASESSISTNSIFYRGDVLFGKLRPNLRKSLAAPFDGYCSTDILVLQPNPAFDPGFVARVFQRNEVFGEAVRTAEGTKMPRTSWKNLKDYRVYVPKTNLEQHQISHILDTIDEAIQKTEQLIAKLKAIKQGLLHDLLTRGLDENGQLRDPVAHPEQFKDSPLGRIPKGWDIFEIKDICVLGRGRVINQNELREHPGIYPVYSSQSENDGVFGYIDTFDFEGEYVTWTTDGANAGTVFYRTGQFNCTNVCGILKAKEKNLSLRFLASALAQKTKNYVSYIGNPKLMNNVMAKIPVAIPMNGTEQHAIAENIIKIEKHITSENNYLDKLRLLKKGLMHDLLTGKVRVNIPSEETKNEDRHDS